MKLSLYEQETIILYNQAEAAAEVYTHDPPAAGEAAAAGGKVPGSDRKKRPADLHGPQTLRVRPGAVQRRAPQGGQ